MNKIQLMNIGPDYSGLGLGQLQTAYNPYTDGAITLLGAWDADDTSTFTVDGSNKVLTMPSKVGGFALTPYSGTYKADYQASGWAGGVNPLSDTQANGAFLFTGGAGNNSTVYSGAGPLPPAEGVTIYVLAQRGTQTARVSGVGLRPVASIASYPYPAGGVQAQYSALGCMDATSDPAQTSATFGQHQNGLSSNANMASWVAGSKAVLVGSATSAGHAVGLNGVDPAGAASYFNIPPQGTGNTYSLGGGFNMPDAGFSGLVKLAMVVSNAGMTSAKRKKLEGYFAWRGGIQTQLPISHTFSNDGP